MTEVIAFGEALIDLVALESGVTVAEASGFNKAPGGAPANVAVGLARLGVEAGFVGKVGQDPFGEYLVNVLSREGVDTSQVVYSKQARTGLAFIYLTAEGEREFSFYRHPAADMLYHPEEINPDYLDQAQIFHFGSLSTIAEPSRAATRAWVDHARDRDVLISFDPNLRLNLWPDPESARKCIGELWPLADVVKISGEEFDFMLPEEEIDLTNREQLVQAARSLVERGLKLLTVTLGQEGCLAVSGEYAGFFPGCAVNTVDTTGAGDGFTAGLLAGLIQADPDHRFQPAALEKILPLANAAGALTTTRKGAIPALPTLSEVQNLLTGDSSQNMIH